MRPRTALRNRKHVYINLQAYTKPHFAVFYFKNSLTAFCGFFPDEKMTNRTVRFLAQTKNGKPQIAVSRSDKKRQTANCGFLPDEKTTNRKMRFLAQTKNSKPQNAVSCLTKKQQTAKCGFVFLKKDFRILRFAFRNSLILH